MSGPDISDDRSVCSANSAASSVHDSIVDETDRRKKRIHRLRKGRRNKDNVNGGDYHPDDSIASSIATGAGSTFTNGGIMSVRTQEESLENGHVPRMRKLRRKVTIKFKSTGDLAGAIDGTESISLASCSIASEISVDFSKVHIREYEVVPGQNPSCSCGPPIELGWRHGETLNFDLERFEGVREGRRRLQAQMRMPPDTRRGLLLNHGSSQKHIREATKSSAALRKERTDSLAKLSAKGTRGFGSGTGVKKLFQKFGKKKDAVKA